MRVPVPAPFSCTVWMHCVTVGQVVQVGEDVVVVEAMKMEMPAASPVTGRVTWIAESGQMVEAGDAVAVVETEGGQGG